MVKKNAILVLLFICIFMTQGVSAKSFEVNFKANNGNIVVTWTNEGASAYLIEVYQDGIKTHSNWVYGTKWEIPEKSLTGDTIKFLVAPPGEPFAESLYIRNYKQKSINYSPIGEIKTHDVWFSWSNTIYANKYYFELAKSDGSSLNKFFVNGKTATPKLILSNGQYKWRVTPYTTGDKRGLPSEWAYFFVNEKTHTENVFGVEKDAELPPLSTSLTYPHQAIMGNDGAIYVADSQSNVIRKYIDEKCEIYVGTVIAGYNGNGHDRLKTQLDLPTGLVFDGKELVFLDTNNHLLRKVDLLGNVVTIADYKDWAQNVYVHPEYGYIVPASDLKTNTGKIYTISKTGTIEIMPVDYKLAYPLAIDIRGNRLIVLDRGLKKLLVFDSGKLLQEVSLDNPTALRVEEDRILIGNQTTVNEMKYNSKSLTNPIDANSLQTFSDGYANIVDISEGEKDATYLITDSDSGKILSVDKNTGIKEQIFGLESSSPAVSQMVKYKEDLYMLDNESATVWKYNMKTGIVERYIGKGQQELATIGSTRLETSLFYPTGLAIDAKGNVYIAEQHHILKMNASTQKIELFAGANGRNNYGYNGENINRKDALFQGIHHLYFDDTTESLYVADTYNNRIRKILKDGIVKTVAGNGEMGMPTFGVKATNSKLNKPYDMILMPDGTLVFSDAWNNAVYKLDGKGILHPFAGMPNYQINQGLGQYSGDKDSSQKARLNTPNGLFYQDDYIYIVDSFNNRIRVVNSKGRIYTLIGSNKKGFSPVDSCVLNLPSAVFVDDKYVYVADTGNHLVRRYEKSVLPFDYIEFIEKAVKGAWHEIDAGAKTSYDPILGYTEAIYRQLTSQPNLLYKNLASGNTLFTEDMGMSAYELDRYGNVVWKRRIQGETYYGIIAINSDELLLSILNKSKLLKINKKTGKEKIIAEDDFRDIHLTKENKIAVVQNKEKGKIILMDLNGKVLWTSKDTFYWARGIWQKRNRNFLVVDFRNKAYEVDYKSGKIIWQFEDGLYYPNSIQEMRNGNYLIADEHNSRIIEINPQNRKIVKEYYKGLFSPNYARELESGNWLICDTDNHRIIEIDIYDKIVWELSNLHAPNRAVRAE